MVPPPACDAFPGPSMTVIILLSLALASVGVLLFLACTRRGGASTPLVKRVRANGFEPCAARGCAHACLRVWWSQGPVVERSEGGGNEPREAEMVAPTEVVLKNKRIV